MMTYKLVARPRRKMAGGRKRKNIRRRVRGGSLLTKIHNYVKDNRLVSKALGAVHKYAGTYQPLVKGLQNQAGKLGYGRRGRMPRKRTTYRRPVKGLGKKRRRRRHRGGNWVSDVNDWLKKSKILSGIGTVANNLGFNPDGGLITGALKTAGYGRRRRGTRTTRRRYMRSGSGRSMSMYGCGPGPYVQAGGSRMIF